MCLYYYEMFQPFSTEYFSYILFVYVVLYIISNIYIAFFFFVIQIYTIITFYRYTLVEYMLLHMMMKWWKIILELSSCLLLFLYFMIKICISYFHSVLFLFIFYVSNSKWWKESNNNKLQEKHNNRINVKKKLNGSVKGITRWNITVHFCSVCLHNILFIFFANKFSIQL